MSTAIHRNTAQLVGVCCILIFICGVLEAFCGILWRYFEPNGWSTGKWLFDGFQGVWSGAVFIVTGIIGGIVWLLKTRKTLIVVLVGAALVVITGVAQALFSGLVIQMFNESLEEASCDISSTECACTSERVALTPPVNLTTTGCEYVRKVYSLWLGVTVCSSIGAFFALVAFAVGCFENCQLRKMKRSNWD